MKRIILLGLCVAACSRGDASDTPKTSGKRGHGGNPVEVAPLESKQMQYTVEATGSIDAFQSVQITARVAGAVDKVAFKEGQDVKVGDVLATIESDRYAIAVSQARAAVAKAAATQKANEGALNRRLEAEKASQGLVPGEEIEQKRAAVDTAKADVSAANEQLHVAELNLRDSQVKAPIAGTVQTRTVQQGQYLAPGAVLATILQEYPLLVRFQVSASDAPRLSAVMEAGQKAVPPTPVKANITMAESKNVFTATLQLVSGAADPTTRLVNVVAQLDPTDKQFWLRPGAFCQVSVPVDKAREGIVVPSLAVQPGEKGNTVYIVDDKNIAHQTVVELGMHTADGGVELTRGVKAGNLLVTAGAEPLTDGAPVNITARKTIADVLKPPPPASQQSFDVPSAGSGAGSGSGSHEHAGSGGGSGGGSGSGHRHKKDAAP